MATGQSQEQAERIVDAERARRPRWRSAPRTAPAWFAGEELDLLEPLERDKLYLELRQHMPGSRWLPVVIALCNLSNAFHGLQSEHTRPLWIAILCGFALLALGAWQYRRRGILAAARRHVCESADWPLRLQSRHPEKFV